MNFRISVCLLVCAAVAPVSMLGASATAVNWTLLANEMTGDLVLPSAPSYQNDSMQWNTRFLNKPAAIAYCNNSQDVSKSVLFSRSNNVTFSVRSGGHNTEGWAVCSGCLVIDVSHMKAIAPHEGYVVTAETGLMLSEYDHATVDVAGFMSPTGLCPSVGLGGYSTGGGIGWTSRSQGLFVDTIVRYDVVLANGSIVMAGVDASVPNTNLSSYLPITGEPREGIVNEDLFWALRGGGGGNLGIVTSITLVAQPAPKQVLYAEFQWDPSVAVNATRHFLASTDDDFCFFLLFIRPVPGKVLVLMQGIWSGDPVVGMEKLRPFHDLATSTAGGVASYANMSYSQAKANFSSGGLSVPIAGKQKSAFVPPGSVSAMAEAGVAAILAAIAEIPDAAGGHSSIYMNHMGSSINAPGAGDTAFPHRTYTANFVIDAHWELTAGKAAAQSIVDWTRSAYNAVAPYLAGATYVNYLDRDLCIPELSPFAANWTQLYYGENYERLQEVKQRYDPEGVFTTWPQAINGDCKVSVLP